MSDIVIKAENISKQYRLGQIGTGTLSHDLNRWWYKVRGKEDPYIRIGETNDRTKKGNSDYVWALQNVNFEIKRGEVWGVIGKNGAGKSTLLKILSKVTAPTTGTIKYKGHLASLLEVGTGFHGELTGRENVYLNGAILGMRRNEISSKMDEIVEFAGVEKYIDTPVKRYSSGMYVRLAFAVAAHLDTDILILDEVLAVGDASFQRKCLGKMNDAATQQGKTVLFVSHNLSQVQGLCKKGMLLENGHLIYTGDISSTISKYTFSGKKDTVIDVTKFPRAGVKDFNFEITSLKIKNINQEIIDFYEEDILVAEIEFICKQRYEEITLSIGISDSLDNQLIVCRSSSSLPNLNSEINGKYKVQTQIPLNLLAGVYHISLGAAYLKGILEFIPSVATIEILPQTTNWEDAKKPSVGTIITHLNWTLS